MRVLIVGAGVAGLTLTARLAQQGRRAIVVERAETGEDGYALGLYPSGTSVLHGLGGYDRLLSEGIATGRYELADHEGRVLQAMDMEVLTGQVGPMVMVSRAGLLAILEEVTPGLDLRRGVTVSKITELDDADAVDVDLTDGSKERIDLVVGCDGANSAVRSLAFDPPTTFDTGWALWTWWVDAEIFAPDVVREYWGRGWFFGVYPAPGRVMCACGGPAADRAWSGSTPPVELLRGCLRPLPERLPEIGRALAILGDDTAVYRWPMRDTRSRAWAAGRVALCGDAAASFLPTAGVGASNAMRAAAGLADELSRAGPATVPLALELYEKRCRQTVERNQTESRRLARAMFVEQPALGWLRDQVARHYPAERMLAQIIATAHQPF